MLSYKIGVSRIGGWSAFEIRDLRITSEESTIERIGNLALWKKTERRDGDC